MAFKIAGKDFFEYVAYRLKKDGLGFIPTKVASEGATQRGVYIRSIVPTDPESFMVFAHELGHNKAEQVPHTMQAFFGGVGADSLFNEYMAWQWALRYMEKLRILPTVEVLTKNLSRWFGSYTKQAACKPTANYYIRKLNDKWGTNVPLEAVRQGAGPSNVFRSVSSPAPGGWTLSWPDAGDTTWFGWTGKPSKPVIPAKPRHTKHKPWMDLMDKKNKKFQKYKAKNA